MNRDKFKTNLMQSLAGQHNPLYVLVDRKLEFRFKHTIYFVSIT